MCVLFIYYYPEGSGPYKLIVASNRDEFYDRETLPAQFWPEASDILAGRCGNQKIFYHMFIHVLITGKDCVNGGTWIGMSRQGRFAVLTNYRKHVSDTFVGKTRGNLMKNVYIIIHVLKGGLVLDFLTDTSYTPLEYCQHIKTKALEYDGYNIIVGQLRYFNAICNINVLLIDI